MSRIAILCSGQGLQHAEMFDKIREYSECEQFLKNILKENLLAPIITETLLARKPVDENILFDNIYAQELIGLYQMTIWEKIKNSIPPERLFAGYSLGEIIAYGCAGFITPRHLFSLIRDRATLMSENTKEPCAMVAVKGLRLNTIESLCEQNECHLAIHNPDNHFIIAGEREKILAFAKSCENAHAEKAVMLKINVPSHTPLLSSASEEFSERLDQTPYKPIPTTIILEGVSGKRVFNQKQVKNALTKQISHTIMWERNIDAMIEYGCDIFIELGPGQALKKMANEKLHYGEARSLDEFNNLDEFDSWLSNTLVRLRA